VNFSEYQSYDGIGLAELVKKKEVTPRELMKVAIERANQVNPKIFAINTPMYSEGLKMADSELPKGPFEGVPFLLKDLLADYKGFPMANGSMAYKKFNFVSDGDAEIVKRFKKSGVAIFGKTNTPEFGILGFTEPKAFGASRNPWNTDYTTGGSSGGSGAAVASGITPLASAGDGLGSIRIPSSCLGLFGLKPSRGRNPSGPKAGEYWAGAVSQHVLSRSVRDSACMLDQTHGPDIGSAQQIAPPEQPFLQGIERNPKPLKIAFTLKHPLGFDIDKDCQEAVLKTARLLENLGHTVEEEGPRFNGEELAKVCLTMLMGQVAADIDETQELMGSQSIKQLELVTQTLGLLGKSLSASQYVAEKRKWFHYGQMMDKFHQNYDILVTPTMAQKPFKTGSLQPKPYENVLMKLANTLGLGKLLLKSGIVEEMAKENLRVVPFLQIANLTGQPAMSVPLHWTKENLPIGVHFIAPFAQEGMLLQLAAQLERSAPWSHKVPNL